MPHDLMLLILGVVGMGCAMGAITEIAKSRSKRGGASADALAAYEKRLARVEVALDDLTAAVGRVDEGQQFLTKVLGDRSLPSGGR